MLNLRSAVVVGFFSLPSVELAETNPEAYNNAMAGASAGAGTCAHCSTGIRHHVVVRLENGATALIGTTCADKVGDERLRNCVRNRWTEAELLEREQRDNERRATEQAKADEVATKRAARYEVVKVAVDGLREVGSEFHSSLAAQLLDGPLSWKQANWAMKVLCGRRTKKNADAWDTMYDLITNEPETDN